jgi:hypothetical protein
MRATITPPLKIILVPPSGNLNGQFQLGLSAAGADAQHPLVLFGQPGSGLQADSVTVSAGFVAAKDASSTSATADPSFQVKVSGGKLAVDMKQADSFLSTVTSGTPIEASFDFSGTWQPDTGLHIEGGAQLEIDLPLHLDLGPVTLPTVYLVAGFDNTGLTLELSVALGITLGPIQASVDRLGVQGTLSFPTGGGNLGPANLVVKFKPPDGLGLAVDAGLVAGGGYITFNPDNQEYAGLFQLTLVDTVGVTIIGVLDTQLPDGSSGYSFVLIITFTLPPIQLGFGFTLNQVGGIGGVNRTMAIDALRAGYRAHTLDAIMFPPDPIANAPQIISDIRNFFPVAQGRYLFGPMVQIGWGEPKLITFTLGVLLEVPDPVRIVILGLIDAGLPTEDEALLELHIDVLGVVDFGTKNLSIDGSLFNSRLLIYALAGDLALRLNWGDNPNFLFALGGFNPHFNTDGLNLPSLARLSVSIGDGDNPRISSNSYFAVTSNTVQFGANLELYASAGGFSIHGYLGYDLLVVVSPFSFEFDFSAGFDVAYDGANLIGLNVDGTISGPTPWHVHADASISLLFVTVSASIDAHWGDTTQATIPSKAVLPDLVAALTNTSSNWSAALPDGATMSVTLATQTASATPVRVHPLGTLQVKEKVVPLDLPISRYGNAAPSDGHEFSIASVQINNQPETIQPLRDYFARGQFQNLSDADKLSAPSFEPYHAGITMGSTAIQNGQDSPRTVTYSEHYIYDPTIPSQPSQLKFYRMPAGIHQALSRQGAGLTSPLKNTGLAKYGIRPAPAAIAVHDPQYVITSVHDLNVSSGILANGAASYSEAEAALQAHLRQHPEDAANLQVMPLHEVAP